MTAARERVKEPSHPTPIPPPPTGLPIATPHQHMVRIVPQAPPEHLHLLSRATSIQAPAVRQLPEDQLRRPRHRPPTSTSARRKTTKPNKRTTFKMARDAFITTAVSREGDDTSNDIPISEGPSRRHQAPSSQRSFWALRYCPTLALQGDQKDDGFSPGKLRPGTT